MGLTRVVMRLGRNPDAGYPDGDEHHGYVVVAPLDKDGKLDLELWRAHKEKCTVDRFSRDAYFGDYGWLDAADSTQPDTDVRFRFSVAG